MNKGDNPYLFEFEALALESEIGGLILRTEMVKNYSWAVPNDTAILEIKKYSPIIELGAGNGYWAYLIEKAGGKVVAFDNKSMVDKDGKWMYADSFKPFNVYKGSVNKISDHPNHTLMLCWPTYDDSFASNALKKYKGEYFIYIGEGEGGCTGDDRFHAILKNQWEIVSVISIPNYFGIHDRLVVYKRIGGKNNE